MTEESVWFTTKQEIDLFHITSRPVLGPNHLPLQQVLGAVSLKVMQQGCELNLGCLHPVARVISDDVGFNPMYIHIYI
jgi:hypothetical protein